MRRILFWTVILATGSIYLAMLLWSLPELARMAGGLRPFDMRPTGYSTAEARAFLAALDEEGRTFYRQVQHGLDFAFPGLFALSLILGFQRLASRPVAMVLSAIAIASAGFDWAENAAVAGLLATPDPTDAAIAMASRMTVMKSALVTLAMTAMLILLVRAGWRRWTKPRSETTAGG
jgi:hypothetical protein